MSSVISANIQLWRQKVADGTITKEELTEAIAAIRKERVGASVKSDTSRAKKAPKEAPNVGDMFNELGI